MAAEHFFDGFDMPLGHPPSLGVFVDDIDVVGGIAATEEDDVVMSEAVVHRGDPFDGAPVIEMIDDMSFAAEGGEELAGGNIPLAVIPGIFLPAGATGEDCFVFRVGKLVVVYACGNETRFGFRARFMRDDKQVAIPFMADTARVGGRIDARTPVGLGGAATRRDVLIFSRGQRGGFFNPDDVVFEPEISVDVLFALIMSGDNA